VATVVVTAVAAAAAAAAAANTRNFGDASHNWPYLI
jgi:hypothetical protein